LPLRDGWGADGGWRAGGRPVLGDHVGGLLEHHGLDGLGGLAVHAAQPPGQDLLGGQGARSSHSPAASMPISPNGNSTVRATATSKLENSISP
jgi:hypothetical protein